MDNEADEECVLWECYEYLVNREAVVSNLMKELISELHIYDVNVCLEGIENHIKSRNSFINKCNRPDRLYPKLFYIYDVLRYTIILPIKSFYDYYCKIISVMERKGLKIYRVKNTWIKFDKDIPYRGVNVIVVNENAAIFETQFHTCESYSLNIKTHKLYEELLGYSSSSYEASVIKNKMFNEINGIQVPNKVYDILGYEKNQELFKVILKFVKSLN